MIKFVIAKPLIPGRFTKYVFFSDLDKHFEKVGKRQKLQYLDFSIHIISFLTKTAGRFIAAGEFDGNLNLRFGSTVSKRSQKDS